MQGQENNTQNTNIIYEWDIIVIGGGSGGLAAAKELKICDPSLRIACFDFVTPAPHTGTRWRIGGTCVNVGCIPKKLMHHTGNLGECLSAAKDVGWNINDNSISHTWETMQTKIANYINQLNFIYSTGLINADISYINAKVEFTGSNSISFTDRKGKISNTTFKQAIISVGGRPTLDYMGQEYCITSDDIFWRKSSPGRTLIIGGGYIAIELASILVDLNIPVTVMVRSMPMRKFDEQCGSQICELLERRGVNFIFPVDIQNIKLKNADTDADTNNLDRPRIVNYAININAIKYTCSLEYDTVILAIARTPSTSNLGCDKAGIILNNNGKIVVDEADTTSCPNIYAIGDVATSTDNGTELTPVAILSGKLLARRIMNKSQALMNYHNVPTTIFSSPEYSFVGLTTEEAEKQYGKDNIDVWWSRYSSLEDTVIKRKTSNINSGSKKFTDDNLWMAKYAQQNNYKWSDVEFDIKYSGSSYYEVKHNEYNGNIINKYRNNDDNEWLYDVEFIDNNDLIRAKGLTANDLCDRNKSLEYRTERFINGRNLAKLIIVKDTDRVIGIHFIGDNAGEIMQGFALAFKMGLTKSMFDELVGIHPTTAEEFTVLNIKRSDGKNFFKKAGCGGGSCG